jgi:hypothetical protein
MVLGTLEILYDSDQLTQRDARRPLSRVIPPRRGLMTPDTIARRERPEGGMADVWLSVAAS